MKIPKTAIHLMVGLEGVILIVVLVFAVLNPIKNVVVENKGSKNEQQNNAVASTDSESKTEFETESEDEPPVQAMVYSDDVQEKVSSMSLEQKVAQMFITTPEQLTDMRQVTVTGNTTRNAISSIPVGGIMYSSLNFEGSIQTASMTEALQEYYQQQFGYLLFMMVAEHGGAENSPLATSNGFTVEKSPVEIEAENNSDTAFSVATNIATYMQNQGLNTNVGLEESSILDTTISAYKESGIFTATTYYNEQADMIMLNSSEPFSDAVNALRYEKGYQGILLADGISDIHTVIEAINAGVDMVYCPEDFKTVYQSVLEAVEDGTIEEEVINNAVMRILTYKNYE